MEIYVAGTETLITIPLLDGAGNSIVGPDSASYQVLDAAGEVVVGSTNLAVSPTDTQYAIAVSALSNALVTGQVRDIREVIITFVKDGVTRIAEQSYILQLTDTLQVGLNSFQTYNQANLAALDLTAIDDFMMADKATKQTALVNGYINLCGMQFALGMLLPDEPGCSQGRERPLKNLSTLTADQLASLPAPFLRALTLAQIVEANEQLDQNSPARKRQLGIMSETIGESSMMFRPGRPLQVSICRRSMDLLREYIDWEMGLGRG